MHCTPSSHPPPSLSTTKCWHGPAQTGKHAVSQHRRGNQAFTNRDAIPCRKYPIDPLVCARQSTLPIEERCEAWSNTSFINFRPPFHSCAPFSPAHLITIRANMIPGLGPTSASVAAELPEGWQCLTAARRGGANKHVGAVGAGCCGKFFVVCIGKDREWKTRGGGVMLL